MKKQIAFLNRYSLIFHLVLACLLTLLIETISRHSFGSAITFVTQHTLAYFYNAFIIFSSLTVVYLFRLRAQMRVLISGIWLFLGAVNGCILSNRVTPLCYTDLKCISDLFAMRNTNYFTKEEAALVLALSVLFFAGLGVLVVKGPRYQGKRRPILASGFTAALLFIGLPATTLAAQETDILASYFSNIAQGYRDYGFVYGFSTSIVDRGMKKPEHYSKEMIEAIESAVNASGHVTQLPPSEKPNLVCVLLESFCDPYEIRFLTISEDPIPNFHRLEKEFSSGYLTVPVVGAGTANTEFEILTGMSMRYFGAGEYPYKTILKKTDCESIASALSSIGYKTHVVHNNTATFYSRKNAFSKMGFHTFTSKECMNITQYTPNGNWPLDDILVSETIKALDATENEPDFVYTITVGAHGDYPKEPVIKTPEILVSVSGADRNVFQWEYYVNMLHAADRFIGKLVDALEKRDEDTILVLFGDHLPTLGLSDSDVKSGDLFQTKYITWNNIGLTKEDADLAAYQLLAELTNRAGIHEGTMFRYTQAQSRSSAYLTGLSYLQYDLLYGNRFAYHGADPHLAAELEMDVEDILITALEKYENSNLLFVRGSNFTRNTKIFVNGRQIPTSFLSESIVMTSLDHVADGDAVTVKITGSKGILLRECPMELIYKDKSYT